MLYFRAGGEPPEEGPEDEFMKDVTLVIHTLAVVPHEEDHYREKITKICDTFENGYVFLMKMRTLKWTPYP